MRELLLQNNQPNIKAIASLALPLAVIGISSQLATISHYRDDELRTAFRYLAQSLLLPFLTTLIWAFTLARIKSPDRLKDILLPSLATAVFVFVYKFALDSNYTVASTQKTPGDIMYYITPFISYPILITFSTALFSQFKDKIWLYVLACAVQWIITYGVYGLANNALSVGTLIHNIPFAAIQYFLTLYFFILFAINWKTLNHTELREQELTQKVQAARDTDIPKEQITELLEPEFPDFNKARMADIINRTAAPTDLQAAKSINTTFIVLLSLTCLIITGIFFRKFSGGLSDFSWHQPLEIALYILMPAFICLRLYILCGLIAFRPHAYSLLSVLALLGIIIHMGFMFYAGFSGFNFIALICNAGVLWLTRTLLRQLYPDYSSSGNG